MLLQNKGLFILIFKKILFVVILITSLEIVCFLILLVLSPVKDSYSLIDPSNIPNYEESVVEGKLQLAGRGYSNDIVILGDSSALMNIIPEVIKKESGFSAVNLGTIATLTTIGHIKILDYYLNNSPAPKVVVYHFSANSFQMDTRTSTYTKNIDNYIMMHSKNRFILHPSRDVKLYFISLINFLFLDNHANLKVKRGKYGSHLEILKSVNDNAGYLEEFETKDWHLQASQKLDFEYNTNLIDEFDKLKALSNKYGFKIVLMFTPLAAHYNIATNVSNLLKIESELQKRALSWDFILYPVIRFYENSYGTKNHNHLTHEGAIKNSKELAALLNRTKKH